MMKLDTLPPIPVSQNALSSPLTAPSIPPKELKKKLTAGKNNFAINNQNAEYLLQS